MDDSMIRFLIYEAGVLTLAVLLYWYFRRHRHKTGHRKISIGEYVLGDRIGKGGMAEIFLAQHRGLKQPVAIKILQNKSDKDIVQKFLMEGKNLKAIKKKFPKSPVVLVHDYGLEKTTNQYIIIMEYLPGENLKKILDTKKLMDFNLKLHIIKEVAKALQASHALGIFHRDVSPENIMVNNDGKRVTLIDFGIAKGMLSNYQTGPGVVLGKLHYISPEQFGRGEVTDRSDIYSLGVVSYYLVEGKPLFQSKNPYELMNMHVTAPVPPIKAKVPEDLKNFIYRMLDKNPENRPEAHEVVEKMRALLHAAGRTGQYETMTRYS